MAAANAKLHQARRQLASYAVEAYVDGGESDLPDILLTGKGPDVVSQVEYLKSASSNRSQLIDDVRAAEYAMQDPPRPSSRRRRRRPRRCRPS